ncbi:MAG: RNA-binding protein [Chlamydiales bacterium]|nr:RNA-binding protein [Chlamydiales bacterium]
MKLYVGNLSYDATEEELKELFGEFGDVVSVKLVSDRYTGRPKGFGFVEMGSRDGGQKAIAALNGKDFRSRAMSVDEARPQTDRPERSSERAPGGASRGGPRQQRQW